MTSQNSSDWHSLVRRPSAYAPFVLSAVALIILLGYVRRYGSSREIDEGAAAHAWQLLMAAQVPLIGFFVMRWRSEAPKAVLCIATFQLLAAIAAMAPVYLLGL